MDRSTPVDHSLFGSSPTQALSAITSASSSSGANTVTAASGASRQKRKRNRAILSCRPCHDRKQQCDRAQPCKRCVTRGTQEECKYDRVVQTSFRVRPDQEDHLSRHVSRLENVVQNTFREMEPTALVGLEALLQLVQASSAVGTPPVPGSNRDHPVQVAAAALGQLSQQTAPGIPPPPQVWGPVTELMNHIRGGNPAVPTGLAALADLRTHFPNHAMTGHLLYHFFEHSSIPWLWAVVHKPIFESCYLTFSSGPHPPSLDFIALLAMVCASSLQFLPETPADSSIFSEYEPGRKVLQKRLYEFSRSVLLHNDAVFPTVERIQALALLTLYQLNDGNLAGYYNSSATAIRMAQSLAMNREASIAWKTNSIGAEVRRRLWWILFVLDRFQSLMLHRPYMIHDQHFDTALPHNLDQSEVQDIPNLHDKQLDVPTEHTFHILQIRWAKLTGKIWDECFATRLPSYRVVFELEEEIRKFELELPSSFRSQTMQNAVERPYFLFQNRVLTLQIYHTRAILLRPFLFARENGKDLSGKDQKLADFHRHARAVCLLFCKRLLAWQLLIQKQVDQPQLRWSEPVVRIFDAAFMLGMAILLDPLQSQNQELDEWVALAQNLLRDMGNFNTLAPNAVQCLDVVRRRTRYTLQPAVDPSSAFPPPIETGHYLERATRTLAQPQPIIIDLFDTHGATDTLWCAEKVAAFTGHFPGIDVLTGNDAPETLRAFLDNCASTPF